MPQYRCIILDAHGKKTEIIREASDEKKLTVSVNESGSFLISYHIVKEVELYKTRKYFSKTCILEFTEIMSALLQAGLTIQDALELSTTMTSNTKIAFLSRGLLRMVAQGVPFHATLKMYGSSFSPLYQSLIKLGEKTGSAAGIFRRMALYMRSEKKMRGKVGNALWYPLFILIAAIAGCIGIIFYIMPRMITIFRAFNIGETDLVAEVSSIYLSLWILLTVLILLITAVILILLFYKISEHFALWLDGWFLRLPIIGAFIEAIQTLDFSFAMEMLTGSGITVNSAITESSSVVTNRAFREAILTVHNLLLRGERLSKAFMDQKEFPAYIGMWIAVGERTGTVERVFSQIREYFQNDVDHGADRLMGIAEPCLTLLIGMIVSTLIIQFVLPIFSLYGRIV
jgi:type II secretory pathway component PulF